MSGRGALADGVWTNAFAAVAKPRPRLTVSEWADRHRVVAAPSPEPGAWRTSRVPYLRGIMDAVSDPAVDTVVVQAGSQVGKTEFLINVIGYYAHQSPTSILMVRPERAEAEEFSKERIAPNFLASPSLRGLLSDGKRDSDNTILSKHFPGGYLVFAWSSSAVSLASRPIQVLLFDELDKFSPSTGADGDPVAQAIQRTANFRGRRKIVMVSTPSEDGLSRIAPAYEGTDHRRLWVPCPRCGAFQVLGWGGVVYKNDVGSVDLGNVYYRCEHCQGRIEEWHRSEMLALGEWRADLPENGPANVGFHISGLVSPWASWRALAEEWIEAHRLRDEEKLRAFINLKLGELWTKKADKVDAGMVEANREEYGAEVPEGALMLVAGVDVQDNRLEVEVVGWGVDRESWGIAYEVIPGDTSNEGPTGPWVRLDASLARSWKRADGSALVLWCTCVDLGGHRTEQVYRFCHAGAARNIFAVRGIGRKGEPIASKPVQANNQLRNTRYDVGTDTAKATLFQRLALRSPGPGYCHFPRESGRGYDSEYFRGLCSEQRVSEVRHGVRREYWKPLQTRNEPLDCRVYAMCALEIMQPDIQLPRLAAARQAQRAGVRPAPAGQRGGVRIIHPGVTV